MREILPGLHHWTTEHPNIGQEVSSYYAAEARALLDPMVPEEGLEAAFGDLPEPEHVILTGRHHDRDHGRFVEAFGCDLHVHESGVGEYDGEDVEGYAVGEELGGGITVVANAPIAPDDSVLHLDLDDGVLAFADGLTTMTGELGYMPDFLLGDDPGAVRTALTGALQELLDQSFDHLLFAHGDPIVGGGRKALEAFLSRGA